MTRGERVEAQRLRGNGWHVDAIAAALGVSRRTVYRALTAPYQHYCEAEPCGVVTPRPLCYFHARTAA